MAVVPFALAGSARWVSLQLSWDMLWCPHVEWVLCSAASATWHRCVALCPTTSQQVCDIPQPVAGLEDHPHCVEEGLCQQQPEPASRLETELLFCLPRRQRFMATSEPLPCVLSRGALHGRQAHGGTLICQAGGEGISLPTEAAWLPRAWENMGRWCQPCKG